MAQNSNVPVHPLLEKLAQDRRAAIGIRGYRGPAQRGRVCIHRTLGPTSQVLEFDEKDILHTIAEKDGRGRVVFFVEAGCDAKVGRGLKTRLSDVALVAMSASAAARSCSCSGRTVQAARAPRAPIDDGPELPPLWCELGCEQMLNSCLEFSHDGYDRMWCWVDYYVCRLGCIYDDGGTVFI